jgi:nucleotide-binding universal stress UspA family protein
MLKKILVPLDGSELAERGLTYATALATSTGAQLVLLRAALSHTFIGVDSRERQTGAIQEAELYLDDVATWVRAGGFTCEAVVTYGRAAESIINQARLSGADLIVMTTHGRTGPGRWIFGSVTESVVANSPVPVLVQRAWGPQFGGPLWSEQPELLAAVDGSAFAEAALEVAASLTEALHGRFVLVRVEDDPARLAAAMEYLPLAQARLAANHPGLPIVTDIRVGDAAYGIEEALAQREAEFVVMATHARSGAKRAIIGSIAGKILQHASVPMVLLHPARLEEEPSVPASQ